MSLNINKRLIATFLPNLGLKKVLILLVRGALLIIRSISVKYTAKFQELRAFRQLSPLTSMFRAHHCRQSFTGRDEPGLLTPLIFMYQTLAWSI